MNFPQQQKARVIYSLVLILGLIWIWYSAVPTNTVDYQLIPAPQKDFLAPGISLKSIDGKNIQLSELRGKVVLVNFWASWCPPCKAEMPAIENVYQHYKEKGFEVLAVDSTIQDNPADVSNFIKANDLSFPVLMDLTGIATKTYRIQSLPSTFFIDSFGIIREIELGGPMSEVYLELMISKLLEEKR